ncbi:hypothetical protein SDC9_175079 [bioreactor metagenome]|uniref:Uncharacterized protein n=1 Tax=bioreactor metagenome TaxID=1076179 RepID=A0A645GLP9_9ZZZZ
MLSKYSDNHFLDAVLYAVQRFSVKFMKYEVFLKLIIKAVKAARLGINISRNIRWHMSPRWSNRNYAYD